MPTKNPMIGINFFFSLKIEYRQQEERKDDGKNGALFGHLMDHGIEELYH